MKAQQYALVILIISILIVHNPSYDLASGNVRIIHYKYNDFFAITITDATVTIIKL